MIIKMLFFSEMIPEYLKQGRSEKNVCNSAVNTNTILK